MKLPEGYTADGAVCRDRFSDPVVMYVDTNQFQILSPLGETKLGYEHMPFIVDGKEPASGSSCVGADHGAASRVPERAWAGAFLKHQSSGKEFCAILGSFPHCKRPWRED